DAFRAMLLWGVAHVAGLVVDARVETEFLDDPLALRGAARDADDAAALELRQLADGLSHRARCARNNHRVARLRLADIEQAEVRRHARPAQHVEPLRHRAQA